jgi:cell division inhibitor SulA
MTAVKKLHHRNAWETPIVRKKPAIIETGIAGLDELLPNRGWPKAGLVEIVIPGDHADATALVLPLLAHLGKQDRWMGMVAPPLIPRSRILSDPYVNALRLMQINPHSGRSDLWTLEQMLRGGHYSVVMGWPSCNPGMMARRLRNAAVGGNSLGILFCSESFSRAIRGEGLRLQLEVTESGKLLYLLNAQGKRSSDAMVFAG